MIGRRIKRMIERAAANATEAGPFAGDVFCGRHLYWLDEQICGIGGEFQAETWP
jgi:hypothetical protein